MNEQKTNQTGANSSPNNVPDLDFIDLEQNSNSVSTQMKKSTTIDKKKETIEPQTTVSHPTVKKTSFDFNKLTSKMSSVVKSAKQKYASVSSTESAHKEKDPDKDDSKQPNTIPPAKVTTNKAGGDVKTTTETHDNKISATASSKAHDSKISATASSKAHDSKMTAITSDQATTAVHKDTPTGTGKKSSSSRARFSATHAASRESLTRFFTDADTTEAVKPTETTQSTEAVKPAETAESTEAVKPTKTAESTEAVKPAKTAESTEAVKPAETAESTEAVKPTKTAESTEVVKSAESQKSSEIQDENKSTDLSEDHSKVVIEDNTEYFDEDDSQELNTVSESSITTGFSEKQIDHKKIDKNKIVIEDDIEYFDEEDSQELDTNDEPAVTIAYKRKAVVNHKPKKETSKLNPNTTPSVSLVQESIDSQLEQEPETIHLNEDDVKEQREKFKFSTLVEEIKPYLNTHVLLVTVMIVFVTCLAAKFLTWGERIDISEIESDKSQGYADVLDQILPLTDSSGKPISTGTVDTILTFGNAPFADDRDSDGNLANMIADATGATVYNCSVSDSYLAAQHPFFHSGIAPMDAYSFYWLAILATTKENKHYYDEAISQLGENAPPEAVEVYETLSNIDMDEVDVVTIMYDASDYLMGHQMYDDANHTNIQTFTGNLEAGIELLQVTNPHIRIIVMSPTYAYAINENGEYTSSDMYTYGQDVLSTYVIKEYGSCAARSVSFIDHLYGTITEDNAKKYLVDHLHLNQEGRDLVAERFLNVLNYFNR